MSRNQLIDPDFPQPQEPLLGRPARAAAPHPPKGANGGGGVLGAGLLRSRGGGGAGEGGGTAGTATQRKGANHTPFRPGKSPRQLEGGRAMKKRVAGRGVR